jgi:hypothetical protein
MNRRNFFKILAAGTVGATLDIESLLIPKTLFKPHPAQIAFFNAPFEAGLFGIPYHQTNASMGTWLGIKRTLIPEIKSTREEWVHEPTEKDNEAKRFLEDAISNWGDQCDGPGETTLDSRRKEDISSKPKNPNFRRNTSN